MDIHIKPICEPNEKTENPDWVIFKHGEFSKPLCIISNFEFADMISKFVEFHGMEIKLKSAELPD